MAAAWGVLTAVFAVAAVVAWRAEAMPQAVLLVALAAGSAYLGVGLLTKRWPFSE